MKTRFPLFLGVTVLCLSSSLQAATAGFVALEGSDAVAFHEDAGYTAQLFKYLQGGSALPVLVYTKGGVATDPGGFDGGVATVLTGDLTGVDLSKYSALYVETPGTCCSADITALDGFGAGVNAFIAAGGNVSIENYGGGSYAGVVPGGANPPDSVEGIGAQGATFAHPQPNCTDGERVTADGIAKGFSQPQIDGCWSHQGYETSYWSTFGYQSLMASATDATALASDGEALGFTFNDGTQLGSSFLALGGTLGAPSGVPEPSMTLLLGGALAAVVALKKRFAAR